MAEIDVNRGVVSRLHRETGVRVYMYYDKPGYYYNEHENSVSEEFAEQAGFPVDLHSKARYRSEKLEAFNEAISKQLADAEEAEDKEVLKEKGEYRVLAMAYGSAIVVDKDGVKITPLPIAKELAFGLLDALVPTPVKDKAPKGQSKGAA